MIGRLVGRITSEGADGYVIVDVGGVGYEVRVPLGTTGRAETAEGGVVLWVHTHVREDALDLFGFPSQHDREVFRLLLEVPNVGPRTALSVLSALPPSELAAAVEARNLAVLHQVPGVGKKTAERLVLELREKLPRLGPLPKGPVRASPSADAGRLLGALVNMGYRPPDAERAISALGPRVGAEPLAELLRAALTELSP